MPESVDIENSTDKAVLTSTLKNAGKGSFSVIRQIDSSDCAAACLAMVCQNLGVDLVLSEARASCGANATGMQICHAAHELGLNASFHRAQFKNLQETRLPIIAHWRGNHWVVLLEFKDEKVRVADPAAGEYWLSYEEAKEAFSGYICKISGTGSQREKVQRSNWLIPCLQPFKNVIIPTAVLMLMTVAAEMLIPFLIQNLIDERLFEDDATFRWLVFYTGLAGGAVILGQGLQGMLLSKAAIKSESLILDALLTRWLTMPAKFFKDRSFQELRVRFENVFKIRHFLQESAGVLLFALLELIAIFAMLEHYGQAVLFALMLFPAVVLTFLAFSISHKQAGALKLSTESFMSCLDDLTKGIFSIRASGSNEFFKGLEENAKNKMQETVRRNESDIVLCENAALAIGLASVLFLFYRSGNDYIDGTGTAGTMMAILILSAMALNTLYRVLKHRDSFESGAVIYDYLHDVFDVRSEEERKIKEEEPMSVNWDNCSVSYGEARLNGFSLTLPSRTSNFIFGESELLINTLCHHCQFDSGSLKLERDSLTYDSAADFPRVSSIEECPHIFNLTVYENVAMSDIYDEKRVKWCLRLVLADDLEKELTYGLRTKLLESQLSYEVKMKIALARSLYRKAPVYILQNLSEFLTDRELLVFGYHLKQHLNDRTIIVTDSNPVLGKYCTHVAIVYNGKLKEFGTPENLIKTENAYSKRVRASD